MDLRSSKVTLRMDMLRCKTPELVWKEMWAHVLVYNLVRVVMAQAAAGHDLAPRSVSFKGAVQALLAFQPVIAGLGDRCRTVYEQLLVAVASHRAGNRPDRFEPRLRKQRPKHYAFLRQLRAEVKRRMLKQFGRK